MYQPKLSRTKIAAALLTLLPCAASQAAPVFVLNLTADTSAEVDGSGPVTNSDGPSPSDVDAFASDSSADSYAAADSSGSPSGDFYMRAEGNGASYDARATFKQSYTVTNDNFDQFFDFIFTIENGSLQANCSGDDGYGYGIAAFVAVIDNGCTGGDNAVSGYEANIFLDGSSIWGSSATLTTDINGSALATTGTSLGSYFGGSFFGWGSQSFSIGLGLISANSVFVLDYEVELFGNGVGGQSFGQFGDPNSFVTTSFRTSPVPVPAPIGLVGIGLLALGAVRKKRSQ